MKSSLLNRNWRWSLVEFAVVCVLSGSLAISIAYSAVLTFDPETSPAADAKNYYLPLYRGERPSVNYEHAARRVLVPFLARIVPDLPDSAFTPGRSFDDDFRATVKFAAVNMMFLTLTGCVVYYLARSFPGVAPELGLVASLMYLGLPATVTKGAIPLVDAAYLFFFGLCALAIRHRKPVLLAIAALIGVLAKEQVLLVTALVLLAPYSILSRVKLLAALVPSYLAYAGLSAVIAPPTMAPYAVAQSSARVLESVAYMVSPNGLVRVFLAFGPLWVLAGLGLFRYRTPPILRRWAWFSLLVSAAIPLTGATGLSRHLMILYPVVIPLAVLGLRGAIADVRSQLQDSVVREP